MGEYCTCVTVSLDDTITTTNITPDIDVIPQTDDAGVVADVDDMAEFCY